MLTMNVFGVGATADGRAIQIMRPILPPNNLMTPDEALNLAAWLVALAQPHSKQNFQELLEALS